LDRTANNLRLLGAFRLSAEMRPYVLRVRLSAGSHFDFGQDPQRAVRFSLEIEKMRHILRRRGIAVRIADNAIQKTLHAAADHQLSGFRLEQYRTNEKCSRRVVDRLILELCELRDLISRLPPTSKGILNKRVAGALDQPTFDSDVFISVIEITEASLREVSPRRLADDALFKIRPEGIEDRTPPIISLWEALPASTRLDVERLMQEKKVTALTGWLTTLADLLQERRPALKLGSPRSSSQRFLRRVRCIWTELGLDVGLAYNFYLHPATKDRPGRGGRVASGFQAYCHAALSAFGDFSKISARQVVNAKKGAPETSGRS
jgi:hypothetical protein